VALHLKMTGLRGSSKSIDSGKTVNDGLAVRGEKITMMLVYVAYI